MAEKETSSAVNNEQREVERLKERLDMLDQRLDNIDSVVTAAVERVMSQPVGISITCPNCGKTIEIALIGTPRATG